MPKSKKSVKRKVPAAKRGGDPQRKIKILLLIISFLMILGASAYHAYKRFGVQAPMHPKQSVVKEKQVDRSKSQQETPPQSRPEYGEDLPLTVPNTEEAISESFYQENDSEDPPVDESYEDENSGEDEPPVE